MHILNSARSDVRALRASKALAEAGMAVSIVDVESGGIQHREEEMHGVHVKHIVMPTSFVTTRFKRGAFVTAARLLLKGAAELLRTRADVYHALDLPALPACYLAAALRRKPLIFEAYELPLDILPEAEMGISRRWLNRLVGRLLPVMLGRCAGIITVSPPLVDLLRERYGHPDVRLVRNVPPYSPVVKSNRLRERLGLGLETRIALYQGYIQEDRGLETLVLAAQSLEPNNVIVIMGKAVAETQAHLNDLIARAGVEERVRLLPPVPYEELLDWTSSADIGLVVLPIDYSSSILLCLPNKLFEYLMAGLPVLASPLPAVREVVEKYDVGRVVTSTDPTIVGTAVNELLADEAALESMHHNSLEAARRRLNWESEKAQLTGLYGDLLQHDEADPDGGQPGKTTYADRSDGDHGG